MLKAAIVGYGYMGVIRHRVINTLSDVEVTLICEPDEAKISGDHPFKISRNADDVLNSDADVVFVCTPNNLIPDLTIECLKRGKHVFAEKPPGTCLGDIERMREQEELSQGVKLMFGFNHRYHPGVLRAKELIRSEKFGKILWMRGVYGKSGGKNFKESWRNKKEVSGGGILLDQGIHMLDLFNYFAGSFDEVKSFFSNKYWEMDLEDNAFVILRNREGQHATLHSSATLWKHKFRLEIGLEKGYLIVQGLLSKSGSYGRETLTIGRQQFEDESFAVGNPSEEITYFDKDESWEIEMTRFFDFVRDDKRVDQSSSQDAFNAMKIVDEAYKNDPNY